MRLDAFVLIDLEPAHVERARRVQRTLAAGGKRGRRVPDLLIAAAADSTDLKLLHDDADFDPIGHRRSPVSDGRSRDGVIGVSSGLR